MPGNGGSEGRSGPRITPLGVLVGAVAGLVALGVAAVVAAAIVVNVLTPDPPPPRDRIADREPLEVLPPPQLDGPRSLETALATRRSVRSFTDEPLTLAEIGQLLWAAQGVTDPDGHRTAPSAGATYPLELDVVTADGVARYVPEEHALAWRGTTDLRRALRLAALDQAAVSEAPLVIVISGVVERTAARYGHDRAERYVALEAGHAAQDILLQAGALDLGAVPVGAFVDEGVRRLLSLGEGEAPLYLIPVGRPR